MIDLEPSGRRLVERNVRIALRIAHYGYIMENGRIVFDGSAEKLQGQRST